MSCQLELDLHNPEDPFSETKREFQTRQREVLHVQEHLDDHCVCEGCDSIWTRRSRVVAGGVCPICLSYRFNHEPDFVSDTAFRHAKRPQQVVLPAHMMHPRQK